MMERKINYSILFEKEIEEVKKLDHKPRLLIHACCGPCLTIPFNKLKDIFDITVYYDNSNIYPKDEYDRRLMELKDYLKMIDHPEIKVVEIPYDNAIYMKDLEPYAECHEGGKRCEICFKKRLTSGYKYAQKEGYEYFTTVMSISRYKNSQVLNKIGENLEKELGGVKWLDADFKKKGGYEESLTICKAYNLYFQHYCGCIYSYNAYKAKNKD